MLLLKIIFSIFIIVIALVAILASMSIIRHLWILHSRKCSYCGHSIECKGIVEHEGINQYVFQCPCCGAWEYMPVIDVVKGKEDYCNGKGV